MITTSETRTTTQLNSIRDNITTQNTSQSKLASEISDFLSKYKNNSQFKGNVAETELYYMLQSILPTDEISNVSNTTASCDFKINRHNKNKPSILFESKDYTQNVPTEEVSKFERDIQVQKTHGIMVSQKSPITFKEPFQIDIINGLIHVYVPLTNYDTNKLKIAIDIVDNLDNKLKQIASQTGNANNIDTIPILKDDLEQITKEYQTFGIKKIQMMETIKMVTKQLTDQLEEIQLPNIKNLLVRSGMMENDTGLLCEWCNVFTGKNKAGLAAHMRSCPCKPNLHSVPNVQIQLPNTSSSSNNIPNIPSIPSNSKKLSK